MRCPACNAEPIRDSALLEGLSYCPACRNFFFRGNRPGVGVDGVLRALVEVSGFPDILDQARSAHIACLLAVDDPLAEPLLMLAASGVRPQEALLGEGAPPPRERECSLAGLIVRITRLPVATAASLAHCIVGALDLREQGYDGSE